MKIKKFEKAVACGLIVAVLISAISGFSTFAQECDGIRHSVLRLHILANSDSAKDQALKLRVRDKLLAASPELFGNSGTKQQAMEQVKEKLPQIEKIAREEIKREGYSYPVRAQVVNMYFTTRTYGSVTLPAGSYDALRITIGQAKGHNWWCVIFPSLCLPAAESGVKLDSVLTGSQQSIVTGYSKPNIKIKFKVLEMFDDFQNWLGSISNSKKSAAA